MAGRVAIVGAGFSAVGRDTGFGYKDLAVQSALAAMGDCGIRPGHIDGLSLRAFGQPEPWGEPAESALNDRMLAHMLGMTPLNWYSGAPSTFADLFMAAIARVASRVLSHRHGRTSLPHLRCGGTTSLRSPSMLESSVITNSPHPSGRRDPGWWRASRCSVT